MRSKEFLARHELYPASLAGLAVALCYIAASQDFGFILGTGAFWERPDAETGTSLFTVRYFVAEAWGFPLGHVASMDAPEGANILFAGTVPLIAILAKGIYKLTGYGVNPLGFWFALCMLLQGMTFSALVYQLGARSPIAWALAALIGVVMPTYLYRLTFHILFAPFLAVAALFLYFRVHDAKDARGALRPLTGGAALLVIGVGLDPISTLMALPLVLAAGLHALWKKHCSVGQAVTLAGLAISGMALVMWLLGYLPGEETGSAAAGYGVFSMNLLAPFDLAYSGIARALGFEFVPVDATGGQYEGMQYLGAGGLLLLAVAFLAERKRMLEHARRHVFLILALSGLALLAVTNVVYFGPWKIVELPLPGAVANVVGIVRSSGRFFWPAAFLVIAAAIAAVSIGVRFGLAVIALAVGLQVLDTMYLGEVLYQRGHIGRRPLSYEHLFVDGRSILPGGIASMEAWRELIARHKELRFYPSWNCALEKVGTIGDPFVAADLFNIASTLRVPSNSGYFGRSRKDCYREDGEFRQLQRLDDGVLYIIGDRYREPRRLHLQGLDLADCFHFHPFDHGAVACTSQWHDLKDRFLRKHGDEFRHVSTQALQDLQGSERGMNRAGTPTVAISG